MKTKKSMRTALLDAADDLVHELGAGLLTLDAVAARAGVSKGGLLHHFKSKDALLTAMLARVTDKFEAERQAATATLSANVGDTTAHEVELMMNYIDRSFAGLGSRNRSAMALFAAAAHQPALLQPIRDYFDRRAKETLAHSGSPKAVLTMMLLADGLWLFDALGIPPISGKLRKDIHESVRRWSKAAIETDTVSTAKKRSAQNKRSGKQAGAPSRKTAAKKKSSAAG